MYYRIRKEPIFVDDPCDNCGAYGTTALRETVVTWEPKPKAFHRVECVNCGLKQSTLAWSLEPVETQPDDQRSN